MYLNKNDGRMRERGSEGARENRVYDCCYQKKKGKGKEEARRSALLVSLSQSQRATLRKGNPIEEIRKLDCRADCVLLTQVCGRNLFATF